MNKEQVKRAAIYLRKNGIASSLIAQAFKIRKQTVAGWVAWTHPTLAARRKA